MFGKALGVSRRSVLQHLLFVAADLAGIGPEISGTKRWELFDHDLIGLLGWFTPLEGGLGSPRFAERFGLSAQ